MSAVFPPSSATADAPALPGAASDHALACVAAFFDNEASAQHAALLLPPAVGVLLRPSDSGLLRWSWNSRRWSRGANADDQAWFDHAGLTVLVGACLAGLAALLWFLWTGGVGGPEHVATVVGGSALCGGALGGAFTLFAPQQRHQRRFDARVRQQLVEGHWAVLAHDLPVEKRAEVLRVLRAHCVTWCSVSVAERWV